MTGKQLFRDFLNREIPAGELERINQETGLHLEPGASFLDALAAWAAQLAENSPEWERVCRRYGFTEGTDDG